MMALSPGEQTLHVVAVFGHDEGGADAEFPLAVVDMLDHHIADDVRGARRRRLHMDARMFEPLDPRLHQIAVVIEQRSLIERTLLIGHGWHPVGAVLVEQRHPVAKAPFIEQARLVDEKILERAAVDAGGHREPASSQRHYAASSM